MSKIVLQDDLYRILGAYEQRMNRIEQAIYQPRTTALEFAAAGQGADVSLYRSSAGVLTTDGNLRAQVFVSDTLGAGGLVFHARRLNDALARFYVTTDGVHQWGDGVLPTDTNLSRVGVGLLQTLGSFGIGIAPTAETRLYVNQSSASTATTVYGARVASALNPSAASTAQQHVLNLSGQTAGANPTGAQRVISANMTHNATTTISSFIGMDMSLTKSNTGPLTTAYGIQLSIQNTNATGAIATAYGVHIGGPTATGPITTYAGINISDAAGAAVGALTANGIATAIAINLGAVGAIRWNGEAGSVLWRTADNTLGASGSFHVVSNFTVNGNVRLGDAAADTLGFFGSAGSSQSAGWGVPSGVAGYSGLKTLGVASTLDDVRNYVMTLVQDLRNLGLLGA